MLLFRFRKQRLEKELASDLWRVDYNEIWLRTRRAGSLRSQVHTSAIEKRSCESKIIVSDAVQSQNVECGWIIVLPKRIFTKAGCKDNPIINRPRHNFFCCFL